MPIKSKVYGSWKDGSDIYKDKEGYYIYQWSAKKDIYKKYLAKSWDPKQIEVKNKRKTKKSIKKTKKSIKKTKNKSQKLRWNIFNLF